MIETLLTIFHKNDMPNRIIWSLSVSQLLTDVRATGAKP